MDERGYMPNSGLLSMVDKLGELKDKTKD